MKNYCGTVQDICKGLGTDTNGLTDAEAETRRAEHGKNELAKPKKKGLLRRFAEQLANPMIIVLLIAAIISTVITIVNGGGAQEYAEAGIIFAVVILNCVLGIVQEGKAEKAIEALQKMNASTAKVRRNGAVVQIPSSELVPGDIVLMEAGDAVAADMRLIFSASLKIEEAALTGESVPSEKSAQFTVTDEKESVPLGDRANMAYMGSVVTYGRGEGIVTETGTKTEMGKIANVLHAAADTQTPLQKRLSTLSKILSFAVIGICAVVFVVRMVTTGAYDAEGILGSFMLAVALAVAAIPEGLASVVTIVLSIGVTKMAKQNAIIRRLSAVETLGCAQIICSDKTGTLTQNKMTVVDSFGDLKTLAPAMALCCDSKLSPDGKIIGDPTENALIAFALKHDIDVGKLLKSTPRVAEAPFDSVRKMMSTFHKTGETVTQYTKGAPDEIMRICTHAVIDGKKTALTAETAKKITNKNREYADRALRVIACAYREHKAVPADTAPEKVETGMTFIGLEAMIDPVRPEVKASIESCVSAGIRVVMITGDHKETGAAIAMELGIIKSKDQAISGRELDDINDEDFEKQIESIFVYARVQPEHKVRIVNMWRKKGYVVAMTGDGVNDAPAIKSADIGVGMGITGTDVTKNVADMVLADDNFATIVSAVSEGRRVYDNIQKTIQFLLSSNLSEVLAIFTATLLGFPLFASVHILFINLISDTIPAVALGMEPAATGIMKHPPRSKKDGIFANGIGAGVVCQGVSIAALTLAVYFIIHNLFDPAKAITCAFLTLTAAEMFQVLTLRSLTRSIFAIKRQNWALWGAVVVSIALTLVIIYVPFMAGLFELVPLTWAELGVSFALALAIVPIVETIKGVQYIIKRKKERDAH